MAKILKEEETLAKEQSNLRQENSVLEYAVYLELCLSGLLSLYGIYRSLTAQTYTVLGLGLVFLFLAVSHYIKQQENRDDISKMRSGRSGEKFVSGLLEDDLPNTFYVINDLDVSDGRRSAQNDHLVIAPGGMFLIETKAYAGSLEGSAEEENWSQTKNGNSKSVTNPIQQNRYHREVMEEFLKKRDLDFDLEDLHTFVAMVNKDCDWSIEGQTESVDFAWKLPGKIRNIGDDQKYDHATISRILDALGISLPENLTSQQTRDASNKTESEWWIYRDGEVSDMTYTTEELKTMDLESETKIRRKEDDTWTDADECDELDDP